jgi:hypothetical protein
LYLRLRAAREHHHDDRQILGKPIHATETNRFAKKARHKATDGSKATGSYSRFLALWVD